MQSLTKLWSYKDIGLSTNVRVYETLVLNLLLYNSETWTQKETAKQRLLVFEMGCLRRLAGVSRREHLQNNANKDRLGGRKNVLQQIAGRRMKYFGHVERMPYYRFPYMLIRGRVHGQRSRGRPWKRWMDNVREDCERAGLTLTQAGREAHDRVKWRSIWKLSMRASASPGH